MWGDAVPGGMVETAAAVETAFVATLEALEDPASTVPDAVEVVELTEVSLIEVRDCDPPSAAETEDETLSTALRVVVEEDATSASEVLARSVDDDATVVLTAIAVSSISITSSELSSSSLFLEASAVTSFELEMVLTLTGASAT